MKGLEQGSLCRESRAYPREEGAIQTIKKAAG